jgi:hypothetical protein
LKTYILEKQTLANVVIGKSECHYVDSFDMECVRMRIKDTLVVKHCNTETKIPEKLMSTSVLSMERIVAPE